MATLPETANYNAYEAQTVDYPSTTFLIDRESGRIEKTGGGLEAIKQAIEIILQVERYRYQIYSPNFGHEMNSLIGKPPEYVISMIKRRVKESLSVDNRILSVDNFTFEEASAGTTVKCAFDVKTVFGMVSAEVEV